MAKGVYLHKLPPPSRKGSKLSPEHIEALRKANRGNKYSLGKKDSEETKRLKSVNNARYWQGKIRGKQSPETIAKRSAALKGHKVTQAMRERIGNLAKGLFGRDHPKWTDDKKRPLYKAIRQLYKYVDWRSAIFARDNFACVLCGANKVYIEADHYPVRFIDIVLKHEIEDIDAALKCDELWDRNNGRTLCRKCHRLTPTWGNTRLQRDTQYGLNEVIQNPL